MCGGGGGGGGDGWPSNSKSRKHLIPSGHPAPPLLPRIFTPLSCPPSPPLSPPHTCFPLSQVFLRHSARLVGEFTPDGLAHMVWALAALAYVPDKMWLRAVMGRVSRCC